MARWSYGANIVQVDADIKILSEFLSVLQSDSVRGPSPISSLSPARVTSTCRSYWLSILYLIADVEAISLCESNGDSQLTSAVADRA